MKHKVCLLFTFLSLSVSGISATNGQDSIRQIQLSDLEVQIRWVNPTAIRAYLDDTKTALGGKAPALYEKLSRLETLLPGVQQAFSDKVSGNTVDEVIGQAQEILALKREIILANPLLDMDKIIVARYRLGNKARKAMGPSMGTSTANYNSLFSNSRKGYDAEIDLLTGLRGQIESSRIYKPEADVPVSDIQLHWDADRLLFSSLDKNRKWQIYEMNIDGSNLHQKITVDEPDLEFCDANYLPITTAPRRRSSWRRGRSVMTLPLRKKGSMLCPWTQIRTFWPSSSRSLVWAKAIRFATVFSMINCFQALCFPSRTVA